MDTVKPEMTAQAGTEAGMVGKRKTASSEPDKRRSPAQFDYSRNARLVQFQLRCVLSDNENVRVDQSPRVWLPG